MVNILLTILLMLLAFIMVRLHKAVDELSKTMPTRPTFTQSEKIADDAIELAMYRHKDIDHKVVG